MMGMKPNAKILTYYRLFTTRFNSRFGSMKTDICSQCVRLKTELKLNEKLNKKECCGFGPKDRYTKHRAKTFDQNLNIFLKEH